MLPKCEQYCPLKFTAEQDYQLTLKFKTCSDFNYSCYGCRRSLTEYLQKAEKFCQKLRMTKKLVSYKVFCYLYLVRSFDKYLTRKLLQS